MSLFLLFDAGGRLVETKQVAGFFGELDPIRAFFPKGDAKGRRHTAAEVSPVVLEGIRPAVFHELVSHAARVPRGLLVDPVERIEARAHGRAVKAAEAHVHNAAVEVGLFELSESVRGDLPDSVRAAYLRAKDQLASREAELEDWNNGEGAASVSKTLRDLAGKTLPI